MISFRDAWRLGLAVLAALLAAQAGSDRYAADFTERTMRVDYFHSGTASEEHISLDRVVADGPWPGSRTHLLDPLNLGKYHFEVIDRETNRVLYSRGFSSIYGEWETTPEAKKMWRTFHESLRFPWPKRPVQVTLKKRDAENAFRELWTTILDPNSRFVVPAEAAPRGRVWALEEHGPAVEKVDILVLGDGYTEAEREKFHADAHAFTDALFRAEPFRSRRSDFNVRALDLPAAESGISRPHAGKFRRSPLAAHYSTFDSERYVLTYDNRTVRDVASAGPYDFLMILVNERTYGGGGIYNLYATSYTGGAYSDYVYVHEFGHHFADLADEYYTSDVAYETGAAEHPEPYEANITALHDPEKLKWKDLATPGTPLPTPWKKQEYEEHSRATQQKRRELRAAGAPEEELEKLFRAEEEFDTHLLSTMEHSGKLGAFEGARYEAKGLYRPAADCIMFTRDKVGFCPVCRRALERVIDQYSR